MINIGTDYIGLAFLPLITFLALFLYFGLGIGVGIARAKYKVPVPQISGNEDFERAFRVHQNTLEQIVIFIPSLWMFGLTVNARAAAGLGAIWLVGRILYAWGYYQAAEKRGLGFAVSSLANLILLVGSAIGSIGVINLIVVGFGTGR
jgi:glutathione S-transferase